MRDVIHMPKIVVVGSIGLDNVETPFGKVENALGGSASYAATAASLFAEPGIVSIVGKDFPGEHLRFLESKGIDLEGIKKAQGKTFRWTGKYGFDINIAETLSTELNVMQDFEPKLPESYKNADYLFLGNIDPEKQLSVLEQMKKRPKLIVSDTMNYYIGKKRSKVLEVVKKADIALMNDTEARQLFETANLLKAAKKILELDSEIAIIKKGEHGCLLFTKDTHFAAPGYPLENIKDPTGCGDSFAGALTGYLAHNGKLNEKDFRKAIITASAVASFNAEGFSLNRLGTITNEDINKRILEFKEIAEF